LKWDNSLTKHNTIVFLMLSINKDFYRINAERLSLLLILTAQSYIMKVFYVLFLLVLINTVCHAQNNNAAATDTARKAVIQIHLTNRKQEPLKHEEVLLWATKVRKYYSLITDNKGDATARVDPGYKYTILLKTIEDTTTYGNVDVPALKANETFRGATTIDMIYQPEKHYVFHHLEFDFGKATVKKESYKELEELVEYMQHKTEINVEIDGHTDNVGKEEENLKLSKQRADAVKYYLVKKGIDANRIQTEGFGASQPIADNSTEEGRQKNRRTELKIL